MLNRLRAPFLAVGVAMVEGNQEPQHISSRWPLIAKRVMLQWAALNQNFEMNRQDRAQISHFAIHFFLQSSGGIRCKRRFDLGG